MEIREKLSHIQCELIAPKDKKNDFGGYKYRNVESIMTALKPLLERYKCALTFADTIEQIGSRYYVKTTAALLDCEGLACISATAFAREQDTKRGMDEAQITGAASTYARKYAACALLGISDATLDPDAQKPSDDKPEQSKGRKNSNKKLTSMQVALSRAFAQAVDAGANKDELAQDLKHAFGKSTPEMTDAECEQAIDFLVNNTEGTPETLIFDGTDFKKE